jgi:hypothetical protein
VPSNFGLKPTRARFVLSAVGAFVVLAIVLGAATVGRGDLSRGEAIRANLAGILVPGVVFLFSFWLTWKRYQRFSKKARGARHFPLPAKIVPGRPVCRRRRSRRSLARRS